MAGQNQTKGFYEFGPYLLDPCVRVLLRDGEVVRVTPKALDTLLVLVQHAGQPVSKEELLQSVWPNSLVDESSLAQNISVLRKALGTPGEDGHCIETIPKRGYRFVPTVRFAAAPAAMAAVPADDRVPANSSRRTRIGVLAVAAVVLGGSAGLWYLRQRTTTGLQIHSLAVLPLKNLSGDAGQNNITDGLTDLLRTELSRTLPVRVISRRPATQPGDGARTATPNGAGWNAEALVEGSVIASGDRLHLNVQLTDARTNRRLWSGTYDGNLTDAPRLEEEIARSIAREIGTGAAPARRNRSAQVSRDAMEAYLRARYYLGQRTAADVKKAFDWYQTAIGADPAYAVAYAGLADCYNQMGTVMIGGRMPAESRKLAMAAARRALEIDPELAEAHAALAYANLYEWNWTEAEQGLERAIQLNPNYAPAHLWLGHYHSARGHFERALQEVRVAADLDPLSEINQTQIGWVLGHARRYPEAIRQYRSVLDDHPNYEWAIWQLGLAEIATHAYDPAIQTLRKAADLSNRSPSVIGSLGQAYALGGSRREAESLLAELTSLSRTRYVPPHAFVHIYIGLGEHDKAFEWLEKSYLERSNSLLWLGVSSLFDPLRSDPRFDNLLRRIGLR